MVQVKKTYHFSSMVGMTANFKHKMKSNSLKIGIVAKDKIEFDSFVNKKCFANNETTSYVFISNFSATNSLNLDLVLLANDTMNNLFTDCRFLVR